MGLCQNLSFQKYFSCSNLFLIRTFFQDLSLHFLRRFVGWPVMSKFSLNHVYPFIGLNFVLVLLLSGFIVHETITALKVIGMIFVVAGIIVSSQG